MKNVGRCYQLLVLVQAIVFVGTIALLILAPKPRDEKRYKYVNAVLKGSLTTALEMFKTDCGRYPTIEEGLKSLMARPEEIPPEKWHGPYLEGTTPVDPWGHEYCYHFPAVYSANAYDLYSLGPDGISKTGGNDLDDIGNWEKPQHRPVIDAESIFDKLRVVPLVIPVLFVIRLIVGFFSPRFRAVTDDNQWADWVWFGMTVLIMVMLCIPRISG